MAVIHVPYHLDEYLPSLRIPIPSDTPATDIAVQLPDGDVWSRLAELYDHVAEAVAAQARTGSPVAVCSGDCTVSIGMTAGLQRVGIDPAIVWVDAHGDLQTSETTSSGYLGGMALRLLLGYRSDVIAGPLGLRPPTEDRVVLVDARDLEQPEVDFLDSSPLQRLALAELSAGDLPDGPLILNLDLDTVDPVELPGLRYPAPGGPNAAAVLRAARTIIGTGRVAALNIACTWEPGDHAPEGIREQMTSAILASFADHQTPK